MTWRKHLPLVFTLAVVAHGICVIILIVDMILMTIKASDLKLELMSVKTQLQQCNKARNE